MKRSRLLLIESNSSIREMVEEHLSSLNSFAVEVAEDAQLGIKQAQLGLFDIVITSLKLPDMSGARLLESLVSVRPPPLIIGLTDPDHKEFQESDKFLFSMLSRPFSRTELTNVALGALQQSQNQMCRTVAPPIGKKRGKRHLRRAQKNVDRPVRLGHYQAEHLIGRSSKGTLYKGVDTTTGDPIALRAIPRHLVERLGKGNRWFERFTREASSAASIHHSNISEVLDHGFDEEQRCLFVISQFTKGKTLEEKLEDKPLSRDQATAMALHLAKALEAIHSGGMTHRLLKPSNVVLGSKNEPTLTDIGIAGMLAWDLMPLGERLDETPYLAPEQIKLGRIDDRSDQFVLGLVFHQALTGTFCFEGTSPHGQARHIAQGRTTLHVKAKGEKDDPIVETLETMLQFDPENRFQGDRELIEALNDCL